MTSTARGIRDWASARVPLLTAIAMFTLGSAILTADFPLLLVFDVDQVLPASSPLRLGFLAAICAIELLRSRAPVLALGLVLAAIAAESFIGVSLATILVFSDLLFCATLYGSRRTNRVIIWVAGSVVVTLVLTAIVLAPSWQFVVVTIVQLCGIPLIPVWWAMNVRQQREVARSERSRADQLARIAELDRKAAVAAERGRMARDLHDVIAGHLSAIAIQSEAVLSMVDGDPATMRKVLKSVRENSVASLSEMRSMIGLLQSTEDTEDAERTAPARLRDIERLLESARAAGVEVAASTDITPDLPAAVDLSAYRIVQEALTNVVKHAPGSRAEVTVGRRDGTLVVEVLNERTTSTVDTETGHGLLNMRERAQAVGGVLVAGPDERWWRVRAELPAEGERE